MRTNTHYNNSLQLCYKRYITLALMYQKDLQTGAESTKTILLHTKGDISDISEKLEFTEVDRYLTNIQLSIG